MEGDAIVIVEYDASWPALAEAEGRRLTDAVPAFVSVEHFGSTSVPGLAAKPVVDLMSLVADEGHLDQCVVPLLGLGYDYVPAYEDDMPYRRFFKLRRPDGRGFNVHVVTRGSSFQRDHLLFRDALRENDELAAAYERLKRELAPLFTDVNEYADAKGEFIRSVLDRGRDAEG